MKKIALFLAFFAFFATAFWIRTTKSFFNDTEKITGNVLSVATNWISGTPTPTTQPTPTFTPTLEPTLTPTPELTPTPTPTSVPIVNRLVINEVYYDVGSGKGSEPANEWVEIYNGNSQSVDLQGWQLCDNQDCRSITTSSLVLNSGGFAVITNNESTWGYWAIPDGAIKIVLGSSLSLANVADMLILKDKDNSIIDQMNWGTPSSSWPNYNVNLWNPGPSVAEGHSLEREPAGKDTDTAADFVDRYPPTPGS